MKAEDLPLWGFMTDEEKRTCRALSEADLALAHRWQAEVVAQREDFLAWVERIANGDIGDLDPELLREAEEAIDAMQHRAKSGISAVMGDAHARFHWVDDVPGDTVQNPSHQPP